MTDDALKTLFHPFATGAVEPPAEGTTLFLGAKAGFRLPEGFDAPIAAVQGFRPDFLALERAGVVVSPEISGSDHTAALVLLGRHRGQNEAFVAEALSRTRKGAPVMVAGGRHDGADSLRRRLAEVGLVEGHLSKFHALAFWLRAGPDRAERAGLSPLALTRNADGYDTAPGMFSHERVDRASALLASLLPEAMTGSVADFGAGWGFLAVEIARRAKGLVVLDLHEADHASLEAAKANMARLAPDAPARFFWRDLMREPIAARYDWIVMNPPFHAGRATEPAIGMAMIAAAHGALKAGGKLLLVANVALPYEKALSPLFARHAELAREDGFKVLSATR